MSARPHVYPLDVECFECAAKAGNWCIDSRGYRRAEGYHQARVHLANTGDVEASKVIANAGNKVVAQLRNCAKCMNRGDASEAQHDVLVLW